MKIVVQDDSLFLGVVAEGLTMTMDEGVVWTRLLSI
jgi:hypothetical protein